MNEIVLELAALLLTLFCLIYSISVRRELYATLPKRVMQALQNQHFAFLGVLAAIVLAAFSSVACALAQSLGGGVRTMTALRSLYYLFHNLPVYFFSVFLMDLCGPAKKKGARFWFIYSLPLLLGAVLVVTNPLTHFCFTFTDGAAVQRSGRGLWALFSIAAFYLAAGFLYFFRFCGEMNKTERRATLVLMTVVLSGVVIQAVWNTPVELFFEAIAFFGFMALLEHDRDASENGMSRRFRGSAVVALAFTFLAVIVVNITLIQGLNHFQADRIGNIRLDVIRGDLEDTITAAENNLLQVAVGTENLINANATRRHPYTGDGSPCSRINLIFRKYSLFKREKRCTTRKIEEKRNTENRPLCFLCSPVREAFFKCSKEMFLHDRVVGRFGVIFQLP